MILNNRKVIFMAAIVTSCSALNPVAAKAAEVTLKIKTVINDRGIKDVKSAINVTYQTKSIVVAQSTSEKGELETTFDRGEGGILKVWAIASVECMPRRVRYYSGEYVMTLADDVTDPDPGIYPINMVLDLLGTDPCFFPILPDPILPDPGPIFD